MKIKLAVLLMSISILATAGPARKGPVVLFQPDGSSFVATMTGDEFTRIKTTSEGFPIIQDDEGWWCYAEYGSRGNKGSTGIRVGQAPYAGSRYIPYSALSEAARKKRAAVSSLEGESILRKITGGPELKSDGNTIPIKHGLVILAQFSDVSFKYSKKDFERLLLEEGYSENGGTGCAKEYFDDQFNGLVTFDFQVSDIVTLPRNRAYYGSNGDDGMDKAPADMVKEACEAVDRHIDFAQFDDDNDGKVDNVFIFFAGADEAEGADEDCIWSHAWYIYSGAGITLKLDGKQIDRYACASELRREYTKDKVTELISGIGTFCHEYSHTFGLPDFYDTDYDEEGGWAAGLWGYTSLMDSGNQNNKGNTPPYFNAIEREILGLRKPMMLEKAGVYSMDPINTGDFYRMDTGTDGEYYLFECRNNEGWDSYIGGSGMLVYHIDRTADVINRWTISNTVNTDHSHQCADLIEADSRKDIFSDIQERASLMSNINGIFFPYGEVNSLTSESSPGLTFWNGETGRWGITAIRKEGTSIRFNLIDQIGTSSPPSAVNIEYISFADAAIIRFESSYVYEGEATVRWGRTGQDADTTSVNPYEPGKYAVILEGLESGGKTYTVDIRFLMNEQEGEIGKISFMTKRMPPVGWPYIHIGSSETNSDGTFPPGIRLPLRVYNASDAADIRWSFAGKSITHEGDGFFTISRSGTLKAEVIWEDGSSDIIIKEITIGEE